jgi:aspartyl-tRNA(Asn)/glutamyl-tRNA(Gln) amidotransferase subunit A
LREDEVRNARLRRAGIHSWFMEKLQGLDALLIPTVPCVAPCADQPVVDLGPTNGKLPLTTAGLGDLTCAVALANLPALAIPSGRSQEDLPIGTSLVGPPNQEILLFRLAALWAEASTYRRRTPSLQEATAAARRADASGND